MIERGANGSAEQEIVLEERIGPVDCRVNLGADGDGASFSPNYSSDLSSFIRA